MQSLNRLVAWLFCGSFGSIECLCESNFLTVLKFSSEVIFEIFLLKQRNINQELNDEWQKGVFRGQPLIMGWNFSSFKTLKDNTYTFYCVFDSALNQKHNKQKAYPYPPSLRWDFQRKRAVKFCGVDFSEFLSFWKIKNQQNLQQNRTCKVFMLHDLHSVQANQFHYTTEIQFHIWI